MLYVWITGSGASIKSFICPAFPSALPHLAMRIPSLLEGTAVGALTGGQSDGKGQGGASMLETSEKKAVAHRSGSS